MAQPLPSKQDKAGRVQIFIDRGGTFCDCMGVVPGRDPIVVKLLSVDPSNYADAPTEGIRRILEIATGEKYPRGSSIDTSNIASIRMGTTIATNALLERKGAKSALLTTKGFKDALQIGHQSRPKLFDLDIKKPDVLYEKCIEVDERVTIDQELAEDGHIGTVVEGRGGNKIRVLKAIDETEVTQSLRQLYEEGYRSIAVCLVHSYAYPQHELRIAEIATSIGFSHISVSSQLTPMIKMTPRGMSATADAYLTPVIKNYIENFQRGFTGGLRDPAQTRCQLMQSDGGLIDFRLLSGLRAILSGPAGGLVGYAKTTYDPKDQKPIIGFDMGGTSTDVSRYAGTYEHIFETTLAGITIQTPQLDINTVAAGGGSILSWRNGLFMVGPESAGAHPGPACYRKGGPLTVTDANLYLGRLLADFFPKIFGPSEDLPLDVDIVARKFQELTDTINRDTGNNLTPQEVAIGYLNVADQAMCRPIRSLTEGKGYDARQHRLAAFGGAGGQHACSIASILGINEVVIHKYSSILSAYGMALADVVHEALEPSSEVLSESSLPRIQERMDHLKIEARKRLLDQRFPETALRYERFLNLRYEGTSTELMIAEPPDSDFEGAFSRRYLTEFSFNMPGRPIIVDDIRVRGVAFEPVMVEGDGICDGLTQADKNPIPVPESLRRATTPVHFQDTDSVETAVYMLDDLQPNYVVHGPAIILDQTQTIVITPGSKTVILEGKLVIRVNTERKKDTPPKKLHTESVDPIMLSIFAHRFMSIAEQMGLTLQKTSMSLNIRERLDFSCAIFGPDGGLVANAPHVPVHLGSMQHAVQYQHELHAGTLQPGDVILTNSPAAGGTHLPDLTVISPIFDTDGTSILFYTAARGHHRDIGGKGGMSGHPLCTYLEEEGAVIDSFKLVSKGVFDEDGVREIFISKPAEYPGCTGSNSIDENISDLKAQIAANQRGSNLIQDLFREYGTETVQTYMAAIQKNAELAVRKHLMKIAKVHQEPLYAVDAIEDGTEIHLKITIDPETGDADFNFTGTMPQTYYSNNGPPSVVRSAIIYVLRCIINEEIPLNQGCLAPINIIVPEGTVISPSAGAAVYGCNSMVANRVTDVILKAFRHCAASQGTMNGVQLYGGEICGPDGEFAGYSFMYGETICGGSGAGPTWNGASGVHTHMTNTRAMDPEVLEKRIPILINHFGIRPDSGGKGMYCGGNGAIRIFEPRCKMTFILDNERRTNRPYGMAGGDDGKAGLNMAVLNHPNGGKRVVNVGPKAVLNLKQGERLEIHSPGGGGWGSPATASQGIGLQSEANRSTPSYQRAAGSIHQYSTGQAEF